MNTMIQRITKSFHLIKKYNKWQRIHLKNKLGIYIMEQNLKEMNNKN